MKSTDITRLVDHMFRHQAGHMVAMLTRIFGTEHIGLAEDVVQESMLQAMRKWPYGGIPKKPEAWLMRVAKNRALDVLRRKLMQVQKADSLQFHFERQQRFADTDRVFFAGELRDDQLRMIFICCHPAISPLARVAITLKLVGGFSVAEIARALLTKEKTVAQRLVRAKRKIKDQQMPFAVPGEAEIGSRLQSVLEVIYLMFNEGYSASESEDLVRGDLCDEAIRLSDLLVANPLTAFPQTHALLSLFLFQASRLSERVDSQGELLLLSEQNRNNWDKKMIGMAFRHLEKAAGGDQLTQYHLQAEIAACHAAATRYEGTDWQHILSRYDLLLRFDSSPIVALNRVVALAKVQGARAALAELEDIGQHDEFDNYYPYFATMGVLHEEIGESEIARGCYRKAIELCGNETIRRYFNNRIDTSKSGRASAGSC